METIFAIMLFAAVMLAAAHAPHRATARHRTGSTVAEIQARLTTEQRTFVPRRGW